MKNTCSPAATSSPDWRSFSWNSLVKNQWFKHRTPELPRSLRSNNSTFTWGKMRGTFELKTKSMCFHPPPSFSAMPPTVSLVSSHAYTLNPCISLHLGCIRCLVWGLEINSGLCVSATSPLKQFESGLCPVKKETTNESWNCRCFCSQRMAEFTSAWR